MGSESRPSGDAGSANELPRPRAEQPTEGGRPPDAEFTVDFRPESMGLASNSTPTAAVPPADYAFLEPPRGGDELGWLAHYRVRKAIGSGGMGIVLLGEDTHLLRPVALKVIRPELAASTEAAARFLREARAAAAIKHDNVVTIYQVGEAQGVAFIAMEYLEGVSLARWLDRGRKPSMDLILRIGREVASGLAAAHRLGLVHRDIKPANIWLEAPNGRVKILDFGQARAEREDIQITQFGAIMGTPAFMSPEQAEGKPVSFSSDLFSLGCVLYRLCSGRLPFEGQTILSTLHAVASHTPAPPLALRPEMPESLGALVMRLLAKTPEARPESAQAVVDELRGIERQLAAARKRAAMAPSSPQADSTLDALAGKPAKAASSAPSRAGFVGRQTPRPFVFSLVGLISIIMALAVWFSHPGRFRHDHGPLFPPDKVFRRPPPAGRFDPGGRPEGPDPLSSEEVRPPRPPFASPPPPSGKAQEPKPPLTPPFPPEKSHDEARLPRPIPAEPLAPSTPAPAPEPARPQPSGSDDRRGPPPAAPPASKSAPAPKQELPSPPETDWGIFVDPDGDCRLLLDESRHTATIKVPGTPHILSAELRPPRMNAPRTLIPVSGDFQVSARVLGTERVGGHSTTPEFPPYHGAGLLVWQDPGNYVRFEIATHIWKGKSVHYANFEYRQDSRLVESRGQPSTSGAAYLRLARKSNAIVASFSPDNTKWTAFAVLPTTLAPQVQVGLVAINSSTKPFIAQVEQYRVMVPQQNQGTATP